MSGVFCEYHRKDYRGKYSVSWRMPVQSPNQAILCCRPGCRKLGIVGLSAEEDEAYRKGERIFTFGYFIQVQVE